MLNQWEPISTIFKTDKTKKKQLSQRCWNIDIPNKIFWTEYLPEPIYIQS